jgi:hypothetical protein
MNAVLLKFIPEQLLVHTSHCRIRGKRYATDQYSPHFSDLNVVKWHSRRPVARYSDELSLPIECIPLLIFETENNLSRVILSTYSFSENSHNCDRSPGVEMDCFMTRSSTLSILAYTMDDASRGMVGKVEDGGL